VTRVGEEVMGSLASILDRLDSAQWSRLETLLAEGKAGTMYGCLNLVPLGAEGARELMDAASDEVAHWRSIKRERQALHEQIAGAQRYIQVALAQIKNLDKLGDVEYMDGHADLEAFLGDAGRLLRAAQKIKPTDKDGETE